MLAIILPHIDPVLADLGPIQIRWYSLAYIFGIFFGTSYFQYLAKTVKIKLSRDFIDNFIISIIFSIIIGGRLGFILIYNPYYYLTHPIEILKTWNGGMSFHGGLLGFCVATFLVCRNQKIKTMTILDLAACCAPIGIFLGRIANFINSELCGRASDLPWAVIFPNVDSIARHPSQIYEALTEGLLLFIILNIALRKYKLYKHQGMLSGLFCILYSLFRFSVETFRQPDEQLGFVMYHLTMGQLLSIVMIIFGIFITIKSKNSKKFQ
jgi:phosphatidylglycerol:prolipoprotein diacylglycerol transferase